MPRVQLALNVENLQESVEFYSRLFGTAPAKVREGYANFAVEQPPLKLVLMETPGRGGTLYTVLADSLTFYGEEQASACCGGDAACC